MARLHVSLKTLRKLNLAAVAVTLQTSAVLAAPQQEVNVDSTASARMDTVKVDRAISRFIPFIGRRMHEGDSTDALHERQFVWTDSKYLGDLLWRVPGFFVRDLGEIGQPGELNAFGVDGRGVSLQLDGRPLRDVITGTYGLYEIPLEYVEQVEVLSGASSLYFGSNAPGTALNMATRQYNSVRPMTKIRYLQGPFEHILSDGIYAQNVAQGVNVMVGFQRQVTDGRFPNTKYDSWNVRTRVRFNISDRLNIWLSDFYNRAKRGVNGGIDTRRSPSLYDEVTAVVRTQNSGEIATHRDVTLGAAAKIFPDSTLTSNILLYHSTAEWEYREGSGLASSATITDLHLSSYWGMRLQQEVPLPLGRLEADAEYERRRIDQSRTLGERAEAYASLGAIAHLHFGDFLGTDLSARAEHLREETSLSFGTRLRRELGSGFSLFGDYSRSYRLPTMLEKYWSDSTVTRTGSIGRELHSTLGIGIQFRAGAALDLSISFQDREISDAIVFTPVASSGVFPGVQISNQPEISVTSISGNLALHAWGFDLVNVLAYLKYKEGNETRLVLPQFSLYSELSYRRAFLDGAVDAKAALRARSATGQSGMQFVPPLSLYAEEAEIKLGAFSTIDLYFILKIGDAYATLVWENPLNVNYSCAPFYPMPSRNIKLGVNWVFVD